MLAAAAEDGRLEYHPENVEPCLDAIADPSCDMFVSSYFEECEQALTATVAEGGDCELDDECQGDLRRLIEGSCPGSCVQRVGPGDPCDEDDDCEEGLRCTEPEDAPRGGCAPPDPCCGG